MSLGAQSPNYAGAAQDQAGSSLANTNTQTQANRADQTNAFGAGSGWTQGPNGQWTQTGTLGGPLGDAASGWEQQFAAGAGHPIPTGEQARQQAINAAYGEATKRLDPQFAQEQEQTDAQLANQGLDPNSQAARVAQGNEGLKKSNAYGSAMNDAIGQGNAAGATIFGEGVKSAEMPGEMLSMLQGLTGQQGYNQAERADPLQALQAAMGQGNFNLANSQQMMQLLQSIIGGAGAGAGGLIKGLSAGAGA